MKIFCIGRNYVAHAKELNNDVPSRPMIFMKPPTALLINDDAFFKPDWSEDVHYEGEIVLRICKNGKNIQPEFAHTYYDKVAFGIDFTARDVQTELKQKGHPWELAKAFDKSAAISKFVDFDKSKPVSIKLTLNGNTVQESDSDHLIFSFDTLICYISKYITLQQGDYIYTGTPAGVGAVNIGDKIDGFINDELLLKCSIQ